MPNQDDKVEAVPFGETNTTIYFQFMNAVPYPSIVPYDDELKSFIQFSGK